MYEQIASYYDLTHADLTEDIPFILRCAQLANGRILELGCGSGRLLRPLAQAGYTVTGVDNSATMLARARALLAAQPTAVAQRVTVQQMDMSHLALDGRYALILIPYNTFMHLDSAQALATLKKAVAHAQPGGRLLIDLDNPFTIANSPEDHLLTLENLLTDPESGDLVVQMASNKLDTLEQCLHITWLYDRSPKLGGAVHRTVAQASYHYRYPHQLELMLQESGWGSVAFYGDYGRMPFDEESPRLLVEAAYAG